MSPSRGLPDHAGHAPKEVLHENRWWFQFRARRAARTPARCLRRIANADGAGTKNDWLSTFACHIIMKPRSSVLRCPGNRNRHRVSGMPRREEGRRLRWSDLARSTATILGGLAASLSALACNDSDPASIRTSPLIVLAVSPSAATITVGDSIRLLATTVGTSVTDLVRCSSSAPAVASVNLTTTGCTAVGASPGTAAITITAKSGAFAAASVTVVK